MARTYAWYYDGSPIGGATSKTHTLTSGQTDQDRIECRTEVTYGADSVAALAEYPAATAGLTQIYEDTFTSDTTASYDSDVELTLAAQTATAKTFPVLGAQDGRMIATGTGSFKSFWHIQSGITVGNDYTFTIALTTSKNTSTASTLRVRVDWLTSGDAFISEEVLIADPTANGDDVVAMDGDFTYTAPATAAKARLRIELANWGLTGMEVHWHYYKIEEA